VSLGEKISPKMSGGLGKAREGDFRLWGRGEGKSECNDKKKKKKKRGRRRENVEKEAEEAREEGRRWGKGKNQRQMGMVGESRPSPQVRTG
jgi:hypothetical protein